MKKIISSESKINSFLWSGFTTFFKLVSYFITIKILATQYGPSGFFQFGNLQNLYQIMLMLCTLGMGSSIVSILGKLREYEFSIDSINLMMRLSIIIAITIIFSALIMTQSGYYLNIEKTLGFSIKDLYILLFFLPVYIYVTFSPAIANGLHIRNAPYKINILGSIIGCALIIASLLFLDKIYIVFLVISVPLATGLVGIFWLIRNWNFRIRKFRFRTVRYAFKKNKPYLIMGFVTALIIPAFAIINRLIISSYTTESIAGEYESLLRASYGYCLPFFYFFIYRALRDYTNCSNKMKLKKLLINNVRFIGIIGLIYLFIIFLLRYELISLLLSDKFIGLEGQLTYLIYADYIKIIGWCFSFILLGKALVLGFCLSEFINALSATLLLYFGLQAGLITDSNLTIVHSIANIFQVFVLAFVCFKYLKSGNQL